LVIQSRLRESPLNNGIARLLDKVLNTRIVAALSEFALDDRQAAERRSSEPGDIERLFFANQARLAHKWIHYLPIYDRVFKPYRDKTVTVLEIGVYLGGSLQLWRQYFGPAATLFGIDIDPACASRTEAPNQVRIGSQGDPAFLRSVAREIGALDIVLDDGSHVATHQRIAFHTLWPLLKVGGVYVIEDALTAYMPAFEGGYRRPGTAIEFAKELIDDQHGWYHGRPIKHVDPSQIGAISFEPSFITIEKVNRPRPGHYTTGRAAHQRRSL